MTNNTANAQANPRNLFICAKQSPLIDALKAAFSISHNHLTVHSKPEVPDKALQGQTYHTAIIAAGQTLEKPFLASDPTDWSHVLGADFEQPTFAAQALARHMVAQRTPGRIIFLSGVAGLKPYLNQSVVGSALAALHTVARMAAVDLAPYGITVNVVALGWFEQHWQTASISAETLPANIPAAAYGDLGQAAALCAFLASDAASYLTGAVIPLDGGYTLTKAGAGTPVR